MSHPAVIVDGISKQYQIGMQASRYGLVTETAWKAITSPFRRGDEVASEPDRGDFWALKDVSLEVHEGEILGIVGRNGAGKTTLLKILARITEPTKGQAELFGRLGALLEVGTGFHPELTGRENIYLNGGIIGMSRSEIKSRFDEIVEFAEVERFIDTPVKRYSSGMFVRLAFAVAAHLEPEILVIDEVLAVGDLAFQKKCIGRMDSAAKEGRTVLFVSHNTGAVAELCTRAILLDHGHKVADGPVSDVLSAYSDLIASRHGARTELESDPNLPCSILSVEISDADDRAGTTFDLADDLTLTITYAVQERTHGLQLVTTFARNTVTLFQSFDTDDYSDVPVREPGVYEARYVVPGMFLKAGMYTVDIAIGTPQRLIQSFDAATAFEIEELSVNTHAKGYKRERLGHLIAPGTWETSRIAEPQVNTSEVP
jgi:lipopolysaccharide transport system ATP-binding protein